MATGPDAPATLPMVWQAPVARSTATRSLAMAEKPPVLAETRARSGAVQRHQPQIAVAAVAEQQLRRAGGDQEATERGGGLQQLARRGIACLQQQRGAVEPGDGVALEVQHVGGVRRQRHHAALVAGL
jgi:hypothetical protein